MSLVCQEKKLQTERRSEQLVSDGEPCERLVLRGNHSNMKSQALSDVPDKWASSTVFPQRRV